MTSGMSSLKVANDPTENGVGLMNRYNEASSTTKNEDYSML
jgi:hypothetical protein